MALLQRFQQIKNKSFSIVLALLITFVFDCQGQPAIIKDKDGYSNIREHASNKSTIIDTLHNDHLVYVFENEKIDDWLDVDYNINQKIHSGFIHKSRIVFLRDLPQFETSNATDTTLTLSFKDYELTMVKTKFNNVGKNIQYSKFDGEEPSVNTINGKGPWGTDGNIPREMYKAIHLKSGNEILDFPSESFSDLFEPNLDLTIACYDKDTGKIFIAAGNSDGAGAYMVVWTIYKMKVIGRYTVIPF